MVDSVPSKKIGRNCTTEKMSLQVCLEKKKKLCHDAICGSWIFWKWIGLRWASSDIELSYGLGLAYFTAFLCPVFSLIIIP